MKCLLTIFLAVLLATPLQAEELVKNVSVPQDTMTVTAVPGSQLQPLVEITNPGISAPVYALKGMIRYENVEGEGYLQLDNDFGTSGTFFTKGLERTGPLGHVSGTSDWRPFTLPFAASSNDDASTTPAYPETLSLSLYMPGSGTVSITGIALYQYVPGENPLQFSGSWSGSQIAGLMGGIGGAVLGLWGALIGILAGRGKARGFATVSTNLLLIIGAVSLLAGAAAILKSQPYAVYFPLLLTGVIVLVVFGPLHRTLQVRYESIELKKMQSMDV